LGVPAVPQADSQGNNMNHKFQYKVCKGQVVDLDWDRFRELHKGLPDGDYDLIQRPQISWDTEQMRKYFHGPVLKFVVEQFRGLGTSVSKSQAKEYLKAEFGPDVSVTGLCVAVSVSTSEYDFETYKEFLTSINAWCVECFNCELPPAEQVE